MNLGLRLDVLQAEVVRQSLSPTTWCSVLSAGPLLALGLVFGLKHALDADHLAAVWTIVTERKGVLSSSLVGVLWGVGHAFALLVAGVAVLFLRVEIGARAAQMLELAVAIMLIGLGLSALRKLWHGQTVHLHTHRHGDYVHLHPHLHDGSPEPGPRTHHGFRLGARPLIVGMVHGLGGSAALMLLVLSTIPSPLLGFTYIAVFGIGSIGGMVVMSVLLSLPVQLTAARFTRVHLAVRTLAASSSLGLGLFMAYEIGLASGFFV